MRTVIFDQQSSIPTQSCHNMMLDSNVASMDVFEKERAEVEMYGKCPGGMYPHEFDPMAMNHMHLPHRVRSHGRAARRSKQPFDQYQNFVALVVDPFTGEISKRSSPNLKRARDNILAEAFAKLERHMKNESYDEDIEDEGNKCPGNAAASARKPSNHSSRSKDSPRSSRPNKKRKGVAEPELSEGTLYDEPSRRHEDEPNADKSQPVSYRVDDREAWEKWFNNAFRAVQQVSCRVIAKEWIKTIHPKKQSTHPYNGKNPRTGEKGDSDSTKPPYWPQDVIHREPDHINKEARTKLLVHLLMNTPHQEMSITGDARPNKEITAETLKQSLDQKKLERGMDDIRKKFPILEQIIEARTYLEQYEYGGLSGHAVIDVTNYSDFSRGGRNEESSDEAEEAVDKIESVDIDEDYVDIPSDVEEEGITVKVKPEKTTTKQQEFVKGKRMQKVGKKPTKTHEARTGIAPVKKTEPRAHLIPLQEPMAGVERYHPPMALPDNWETFPESSSLMGHDRMGHQSRPVHSMHDEYGQGQWNNQVQHGREMVPQLDDYCMISTPQMANNSPYPGGPFGSAQQPPFCGMSHSTAFEQANMMHDHGHSQMRCPTQYDAFMVQARPNQHEMMQRAFFGGM